MPAPTRPPDVPKSEAFWWKRDPENPFKRVVKYGVGSKYTKVSVSVLQMLGFSCVNYEGESMKDYARNFQSLEAMQHVTLRKKGLINAPFVKNGARKFGLVMSPMHSCFDGGFQGKQPHVQYWVLRRREEWSVRDWIRILKRDNEDGWRLSAFFKGTRHTGGLALVNYSIGIYGSFSFWFGKQEWLAGFENEAENIEALGGEQGQKWTPA